MNSNRNLLYFLWGILTIILIVFNVLNKIDLDDCKSNNISIKIDSKQENVKFWLNNMRLSSEIKNYLGKTNTSILLYRYSHNMCQSCIFEDLNELYNYQQKIGKDKVLVLPAYENSRENRITLKNELEKFNYKNIHKDSLSIPLDSDGIYRRYFAFMDDEGNINMVFYPIRGRPDLTQLYFSEIDDLFFN